MALNKKLAKSSNDIFSEDGKLAVRSDEDKIFIDSEVVKEIIGEGGGPAEPIPENITLELNTNTDSDPIVNLKYELDGDTLNSPVAFSKDDFKIENNHMRVDAVNGVKIGRNGEGIEGFFKADGSFSPFKVGNLVIDTIGQYTDTTKVPNQYSLSRDMDGYDIIVVCFSTLYTSIKGYFSNSSFNNVILAICPIEKFKDGTTIVSYATNGNTGSGATITINIKYIDSRTIELSKSVTSSKNWNIYGIKFE